MILHHYNVKELTELVKDAKHRIDLIDKEVTKLEEYAPHVPIFYVGDVEVDSFSYLEFLDREKEKFQDSLIRMEKRLFELKKELREIEIR